jgi:uncharacterized integral membrane protein (TIGR00697 family)
MLPAAIIIFPILYIIGDILTEVYGFKMARSVIWLGFFCNLIFVIAIWIAGILPSAELWSENQQSYETILGATPRILIASLAAYTIGELINSLVLSRLKIVTKGKWLWSRTISSTIVGQGLDSLIFITIAFTGTPGIVRMILLQWTVKVTYEILATPITYLVVGYLKKKESIDVTDYEISILPFGRTHD